MPDFTTATLKPPRLASAPSSPVVGQLYYNTAANELRWWNGTAWVVATGSGGGALPADTVVVAATRIIANKLLVGDANNAWRVLGDGRMEWGPGGATALDTALYRVGANSLYTQGALTVATQLAANSVYLGSVSAGTGVLAARASGDANNRYAFDNRGIQAWGDGTAALDTNLYRSAAAILKTDSVFHSAQAILANVGATTQIALGADGKLYFHSAADTSLYRSAAGFLQTDGSFTALGTVTSKRGDGSAAFVWNPATLTGISLYHVVAAEAQPRFYIASGGQLSWGIGGSTAVDVTLYRSAANVLATDDQFQCVGLVTTSTISGLLTAGAALLTGAAPGDTNYRLVMGMDGGMNFGPGNAAADLTLNRSAPGILSVSGQLRIGSAALQVGGVLDRTTSTTDLTNSSAEQSLYSKSIPAGVMGTDKVLRLTVMGDILYNVASTNMIVKIKFGGTTIYADTYNSGTIDGVRHPFILDVLLANLGVANSQMMAARMTVNRIGGNSSPTTGIGRMDFVNTANAPYGLFAGISTLAAIDTTAAQTLDVTVQWGSASTSLSWRKRYAVLEVV